MEFICGIIGTGLLAIPVLAGSAAYAVGEAGLAREPKQAMAFYLVIAAAALVGAGITLSPIDPIKALYGSAVINGVVALPVMIVMMLMTANRRVVGQFVIEGWLQYLGWISTAAMGFCVVAMGVLWWRNHRLRPARDQTSVSARLALLRQKFRVREA